MLCLMTTPEDEAISRRAQEASHVVPFVQIFQDLADEVDGWWADGLAESEIDRRILAGAEALGWDTAKFADGVPALRDMAEDARANLLKALRIDEWTVGCVKSIAKTGKPLPFVYAIGDVFVDKTTLGDDGVLVWAVATQATNPEAVAKKFVRKCKEVFGSGVTRDVTPRKMLPGQYTPAEAYEKHQQHQGQKGMSYRDIAIQNLRRTYPDITSHPYRYKKEIKAEKERVRWEITEFGQVWGKRLPDSYTPD
jgi:hypothetical protein